MSLVTTNFIKIVKKQYAFKFKANIDIISQLIGIQILAIFFSLMGSSNVGTYTDTLVLEAKFYSADIVIGFTMLWALVTGITITTKQYRYQDFAFVTNRLTSNIANIFFLLTMSIIGSLTALLSRNLIFLIVNYFFDLQLINAALTVNEFLLGFVVGLIYIFLFSAIGYFIGTLVQLSKAFAVIIPALFFGSLFVDNNVNNVPKVVKLFEFFFSDKSLLLFSLKGFSLIVILFFASTIIFNRLEVRK